MQSEATQFLLDLQSIVTLYNAELLRHLLTQLAAVEGIGRYKATCILSDHNLLPDRQFKVLSMLDIDLLFAEVYAALGRITCQGMRRETLVITRPDIAFAVSQLTRFNQNPSQEHHDAADRILCYLEKTSGYALQLGSKDTFVTASDASFADNKDRRSSQAYAIKLFSSTIS